MKINAIISKIRQLNEAPTNSVGNNGFTQDGVAPTAGFDKKLFNFALTQDYQNPSELGDITTNVGPVKKQSLTNITQLVDASKEFMNVMNDSRMEKVMKFIRSLREEVAMAPTNNASSGAIAGLPPDQPPVRKKRPPIIARGLMPGARKRWSKKG